MVKKTQSIEGKNPTFLVFSHPDWFLPGEARVCSKNTAVHWLSDLVLFFLSFAYGAAKPQTVEEVLILKFFYLKLVICFSHSPLQPDKKQHKWRWVSSLCQ